MLIIKYFLRIKVKVVALVNLTNAPLIANFARYTGK